MAHTSPVPGSNGDHYIPFDQRTGDKSVVYFTRDLSAQGLVSIFRRVSGVLTGKVAVKVHTGEQYGPNIIPRSWVKALMEQELPGGTIVETNTYYDGDRYTTEKHRKTLEVNGWTFCPVDILDEEGTAMFPIQGGKWFDEMSVGSHLADYDSFLALTHFKGHTMGGFGGSNKNIGIGCADGRVGKGMIHTVPGDPNLWSIAQEELMERMTESTKSVFDRFGRHICYINVLRNMSVSCDCEGTAAMPVVTPNIGIVASLDILAADQAGGPDLCPQARGRPRPGGADGDPPRPAPAVLYEGAGHGQRPLYPHRHRPRRRPHPPRPGGAGRKALRAGWAGVILTAKNHPVPYGTG